jgi:hypothetical protein
MACRGLAPEWEVWFGAGETAVAGWGRHSTHRDPDDRLGDWWAEATDRPGAGQTSRAVRGTRPGAPTMA